MDGKLFIRNLIDRFKFHLTRSSTIKLDDSYINTEVIYNAKFNFMVLVSFSQDYFSDMIEFIAACNSYYDFKESSRLNIKYVHSSYEEDTKMKDDDGNPIILIHEKNYLLLGGTDIDYHIIYNTIDNLSNRILMALTKEIYMHRCSTMYNNFIKASVLNNKFKYKNIEPEYDKFIISRHNKAYDDVNLILSRLPSTFTGQNILKFINTYSIYGNNPSNFTVNSHNAYDYLHSVYIMDSYKYKSAIEEFDEMYKALIKNGSDEVYKNFVGPQYLVMDDEAIPGSISDEHLDEIFREKYEKFTGIASDDIEYEDIDEIIEDDETRVRKFDKIVKINEGENE